MQDAQKRLGHFKAYAGRGAAGVGGRQSPAALDKLLLGDGLPAPPPSSTRTYISVAETHSFFTTFMTLEEKLLLKVRQAAASLVRSSRAFGPLNPGGEGDAGLLVHGL